MDEIVMSEGKSYEPVPWTDEFLQVEHRLVILLKVLDQLSPLTLHLRNAITGERIGNTHEVEQAWSIMCVA